jgi:hypothetical protein
MRAHEGQVERVEVAEANPKLLEQSHEQPDVRSIRRMEYEENPRDKVKEPERNGKGPLSQFVARHTAEFGDLPKASPKEAHVTVIDEVGVSRDPRGKKDQILRERRIFSSWVLCRVVVERLRGDDARVRDVAHKGVRALPRIRGQAELQATLLMRR